MIWYFSLSFNTIFEWKWYGTKKSICDGFGDQLSEEFNATIKFDKTTDHAAIYEFHGTQEEFLIFIIKSGFMAVEDNIV